MTAADRLDGETETGGGAALTGRGDYRLVVVDGPDRGKYLLLDAGDYAIGKQPDCQLILSDAKVSRRHLSVEVSARGVVVRDLDSKNGLYLSNARVTEAYLFPGSIIRVGSTHLRVESAHAAEVEPSTATSIGELHGTSPAMRRVFTLIEQAARSEAAVLIEGETGVGKELAAHAIHALSRRASQRLVIADMAAMPASLIESELFGHVKGAFTGASSDRDGLLAEADRGTLFLDEIGELELALQPRLLRAIEQHRFRPVGATTYRTTNLRVVAATNRSLEEEVQQQRFRADLYFRLAVVRIAIPPLRARKEDIPHLVAHWLEDRGVILAPETLAVLTEHDWPGNVRELRNTIDRALARLRLGATTITPELLGLDGPAAGASIPWPKLGEARFTEARDQMLFAWERHYLQQLLERNGGNVSQAARAGGLDRVYLHRLLKRHQLGRGKAGK